MVIPNSWKCITLGALGEFRNGVNFSRSKKGRGIRIINVKDLFNDSPYIKFENLDKVDLSDYRQINSYLVKKGDMFFSRSSVKRDGVAVVCMSPKSSDEVVHCGFIIRFRLNSPEALPLFLTYLLRSDYYRKLLINISGGAAIFNVSQDRLARFEINLPPISIQEKIITILSAYDDLIENNTRRIQILEEMAQLIYREWFVNFRFPGHEKVKFINSELGKIPEGWEVKRLSDIVETQYGYTESASHEIIGPKFLRGKDINKNSYINWDEVPYCKIETEDYAEYKLNIGDIVIIRMADPGKVGIVEKDIDAIFASYLIRIKIKNGTDPYYLFYFLLSEQYQSYIVGASTGTTRKSASAGVITGTNFLLPDKNILEQFVEVIKPLRQLLNTLLEENINLRTTRDLLLPKLISGELDVSDLDIVVKDINEEK